MLFSATGSIRIYISIVTCSLEDFPVKTRGGMWDVCEQIFRTGIYVNMVTGVRAPASGSTQGLRLGISPHCRVAALCWTRSSPRARWSQDIVCLHLFLFGTLFTKVRQAGKGGRLLNARARENQPGGGIGCQGFVGLQNLLKLLLLDIWKKLNCKNYIPYTDFYNKSNLLLDSELKGTMVLIAI